MPLHFRVQFPRPCSGLVVAADDGLVNILQGTAMWNLLFISSSAKYLNIFIPIRQFLQVNWSQQN